ncbi:MAG: Maf family nucleotide pyrophosphatase [Burkholderiaceae bacterium]|nr:Maf family nucleotide pyrophosphatase [Burkholderiaceae bacterium]
MTHRTAPLILASTSPYRRELLARLTSHFDVQAPGVDETPRSGETPTRTAQRLALEKALAVAARHRDALVIGSDQAATIDGVHAIGKPGDHATACEQLRAASGHTMHFYTAVAAVRAADGFRARAVAETRVRFRRLDDDEIERYLQREQPYDVAGSAKAEGLGIVLLDAIEGDDPTAIIGLPLIALGRMLRDAGLSPLSASGSGAR